MFQAWNVADVTNSYFGVAGWVTGALLTLLVGAVLIGGIKRIGRVTGALVPTMVFFYIVSGVYVLLANAPAIPSMLWLIVSSAFGPTQAAGAFVGGTVGSAFLFGMKRAIFSNEAGQGSSAIAHAAAKTDEPVREGLVAGLEPLIDTLVVCTFTALIILATGVWNRAPDVAFDSTPVVAGSAGHWSIARTVLPAGDWRDGEPVAMIVSAGPNPGTGGKLHRIPGEIHATAQGYVIDWRGFDGARKPTNLDGGFYYDYVGATLTAKAFDTVAPGLGKWLITIASWLFAVSTIIAWGYYGEQGAVYLAGERGALSFRLIYCALIFVATLGHIRTSTDLDNLTGIGLGVIIYANLPILWIFGYQAMRAYRDYRRRLEAGEITPARESAPS
ncbi:MAG TPA: alanine:cation symporter family protein, partial [Woeseiaceae bacterium]|nr:alanine:cation symporter family protein [Woeseiaceae bacterium]